MQSENIRASIWLFLLASVSACLMGQHGLLAAAGQPTSTSVRSRNAATAWQPAPRTHPFLFVNADEIERAREKIKRERRARTTLEQLLAQGEKDLAVQLPVFETDWWREARKKPWGDVYQEIARHTSSIPGPPMHAARRLAQLSLLSGDKRFARRAHEILLHYTKYTFEFEHYDVGMNYSIWGVPALDVYDILYDRFTPAERRRVDAFFRRFFDAVMKNDRYWVENEPGGRFNNHYAFHKQAIAAIGLFYGRNEIVEYALESTEGIRDLMENAIVDDGLWLEGSFHYHFTPLYGLVPLAEMFRHAGGPIDLYTAKFRAGRTLKQLFDAPLDFVFPDGLVPNIGDAYGRDLYVHDIHLYEFASLTQPRGYFMDPEYAWVMERERSKRNERAMLARNRASLFVGRPIDTISTPPTRSRVFSEHGYVFLKLPEGRDYWNGRGWGALLTFDKAGIHSHADKLGLILWGRGRLLAQDVEGVATKGHAFSSAIQRQLNRRTLCSNTVLVDGRDQRYVPKLLRLVDFASTLGVAARATIADTEGLLYPGVRQQRTVIVRPGYVLDVFQVESDEEHTYDWTFHPPDEEGLTRSPLEFKTVPSAHGLVARKVHGQDAHATTQGQDAYWIRNGRRATTDATWHAEWIKDGIRLRLTMLGTPNTEVWWYDFPRDDAFTSPPIPHLQVRRRARATTFVALYQAGTSFGPLRFLRTTASSDDEIIVGIGTAPQGEFSVIPLLPKE